MYSTYTTTINNQAPLSAGMQLCLLTDKQGSPPFAHHYWSHTLLIQWLLVQWLLYSYMVTHTVETQQPEKLLCLLGYSSVYWLISWVLHYCNTVTGHAPYSYRQGKAQGEWLGVVCSATCSHHHIQMSSLKDLLCWDHQTKRVSGYTPSSISPLIHMWSCVSCRPVQWRRQLWWWWRSP